ncbi:cyclic nucleotide-gated ion channel 1-like isoform X2 [Juglans regia]|uniref:Cyclic nucleotide-gated ion channel 1-like isoform X2 n=1 Tax=Juglans regia TaxID=51240 RepID=A0A6P9E5V1_JUGRE|nr:cyclic nucleotide-gated ion channel 1-like isoform X2 [Juglans regia]
MRQRSLTWQENETPYVDIEAQIPENGETEADSEEKKTATKRDSNPVRWLIRKCNIDPQGRFIRTWDLIFLLSCLIAVSVDPLFFYLPVINEDRTCLTLDNRLKITATCLRSVLDFISLSDIILRFICPFTNEDSPDQQHGQTNLVKDAWPIAKRWQFQLYFQIWEVRHIGKYSWALSFSFSMCREFYESSEYGVSSLGQNLQTSPYEWENVFAIFVTILGLLLCLYFIGNVQMYMHLKKNRKLELTYMDKDDKARMKAKEKKAEEWISKNQLPDHMKKEIMSCIRQKLGKKEDIDTENPFPHLPKHLSTEIRRHLCLPQLKKVPMFQEKSEKQLHLICDELKQVYYNEDSYIVRQGEPLDRMLFLTQGYALKFRSGETALRRSIGKGDFIGEQLLTWGFNGSSAPNLSELPISTETIKTHNKVEAFALLANVLRTLVPKVQEVDTVKSEAVQKNTPVEGNLESYYTALQRHEHLRSEIEEGDLVD